MPIDINLIRVDRGGDPEVVKASEVKRGRLSGPTAVDEVINVDKLWRSAVYEMEQLKKDINETNKQIGQRKKTDKTDPCQDFVGKVNEMKINLPLREETAQQLSQKRDTLLASIGNILHDSVPVSNDEANNEVVRTWGTPDKSIVIDGVTPGRLHHHEILARLNGIESKKAVEIAGHRAYFLQGAAVLLNQALITYGLKHLRTRGYLPVQPPFFMKRDVMAQTAELKDFEETLYRIPASQFEDHAKQNDKQSTGNTTGNTTGTTTGNSSSNDLFLIATSEQPISTLHRNEFIDEKTLPYRYAGVSSCFRKEAGSHGKDTWGIFRVHQFEKVEQFVFCTPELSWFHHEEMLSAAESFYQTLNLSYRVVCIVSGAMNDAAAKKYDIEAWFPGYHDYKELVSCSNCTDFQARALNCRVGHPKQGEREKRFAHMLNATLVATQRCLCCILENYQTETGVKVPQVLVPYMDGLEFIPYPSLTN